MCGERKKTENKVRRKYKSLSFNCNENLFFFDPAKRANTIHFFWGGGGFCSTLFSVTCLDTLPHAEATIQTCGYLFHDLYTAGWRRVLSAILILCVYTMMIRPA